MHTIAFRLNQATDSCPLMPGEYVATPEHLEGLPVVQPHHSAFGESSVVVPIRAVPSPAVSLVKLQESRDDEGPNKDGGLSDEENTDEGLAIEYPDMLGNSNYDDLFDTPTVTPSGAVPSRRKANQRWFYSCWIHEYQFKFKSHTCHHFTS